jgi:hypothetical protein
MVPADRGDSYPAWRELGGADWSGLNRRRAVISPVLGVLMALFVLSGLVRILRTVLSLFGVGVSPPLGEVIFGTLYVFGGVQMFRGDWRGLDTILITQAIILVLFVFALFTQGPAALGARRVAAGSVTILLVSYLAAYRRDWGAA